MTNEEKARRLASYFVGDTDKESAAYAYSAAMVMAKWKEEQFEEEKQEWIDKACEWLKANADEWIASHTNIFIDNFKKAMK